MRLFKTEMLFSPASPPANRPRYGGRVQRRARALDDQPEPGDSNCPITLCVMDGMDPESCICRIRDAVWPAGGMEWAA